MVQSNPKKKIAVIGLKGLPAFGGAAAVGENIIEQLKDKYEFTVLSVASHTEKHNKNYKGVRQIVFRAFGNGGVNTLLYYIQSMFFVLFHSYDLIHLHHAASGYITPFLRLKYKVLVTLHGLNRINDPKFSSRQNAFFRYSEKQNLLKANKVISVSKYDAEYLMEKYKRRVDYIPNGIKIQEYNQVNKASDDYILFAAGRIYDIKGLHLVLKALHTVSTPIKLLVAGDLNQVSEYRNEIMQLSADLNIEFLGLIKDKNKLFDYIKQAKLFVFPSLTEAMSMMLLETVSLKTPVIASDIPANTTIFNEEEMLFFTSNDVNDLSSKINYALEHIEAMQAKAERAYKKLQTDYTWEQIAAKYDLVYQELLSKE